MRKDVATSMAPLCTEQLQRIQAGEAAPWTEYRNPFALVVYLFDALLKPTRASDG
jgi:hypothetical protein